MSLDIAAVFSQLRHEKKISQRKAAQDLGISQALLSHYENGIREPRLEFIVRVCDYYGVSADYLFGRTEARENPLAAHCPQPGENESGEAPPACDEEMRRTVSAVSGFLTMLYENCGKHVGDNASEYIAASVYRLFRSMDPSAVKRLSTELQVPERACLQLCDAAVSLAEAGFVCSPDSAENKKRLSEYEKHLKKAYPPLFDALSELIKKADAKAAQPITAK